MSDITIGIIGGTGNMGRWFKDFFSGAGHTVLISGRKTTVSPLDMAKKSDVVILSVPLDVAIRLSEEIGPILSRNQLLMDLCSLKETILKSMLRSTQAQVLGTHPLFGPFTDTIKGQNVIVCPGRGTKWLKWLEDELQAKGALVTRTDPVTHDRNMAVVQGLTHLLTVCMARTLQKMKMFPDEAMSCSTPVFKLKLNLIGRLFSQDPALYASLIGANRHVEDVLATFMSAMDEAKESLLSSQEGGAMAFFDDIRGFLGEFCQDGLDESNKILNKLYGK
ncbi:MAG: prephenate dehydrogenase/arogenate dehydrogenase family protein [Thermodesulfobacteriota bacterium]|nr:prephenate dehydrogenase/arogenate dehydrogenase family protein [Thermodesulfobacteriota bacterium]